MHLPLPLHESSQPHLIPKQRDTTQLSHQVLHGLHKVGVLLLQRVDDDRETLLKVAQLHRRGFR